MSIRITARPAGGIRRAGRHHPPSAVVYPDTYFSDADLERLLADRDLVVEIGDDGDDRSHLSVVDGAAPIGEETAGGERSLFRELAERSEANVDEATTGPVGTVATQEIESSSSAFSPSADAHAAALELLRGLLGDPPVFPPVPQLEDLLNEIPDALTVTLMRGQDARKTAQPIYQARIDQLELSPESK